MITAPWPRHHSFPFPVLLLFRRCPHLGLAVLLSSSPFALRADTLNGEARGTVRDIVSGGPIADATMTLVNVARGWSKQVPTSPDGNYVFIQLEPGNYTVTAEKEGYYSSERTNVLIRLNQPKVVVPPFDLRSLVSTPTQQITVQGEQTRIALVDLTAPGPDPSILAFLNEPGFTSLASTLDWTLRSNYNSLEIHALPLRGGRTFDQLSLLSPGVFRVPFGSGNGPAVGIGVGSTGQFSVNGMRSRSNNFTVDGSDNNDEDIGVRRQGFVALVPQSIESVQDFQIVTAGFPAEFGRNTGSMVNAVSRSGQKNVHGNLYGFFTDDAISAGDFFDQPFEDTVNKGSLSGGRSAGPDSSGQMIGGTLGGPILDERLFYFVSAERQRNRGTAVGHFVVPSAAERGLRIRDGFIPIGELGNFFSDRGIPHSDGAGRGVFSVYPLPNNLAGPFGQNNFSDARPYEGNGSVFSTKIDWYPSADHGVTARYNFTDDDSIIPFTGEAIRSTLATDTRTQNLSLFVNTTTGQFGNVFRFSYGRTRLAFPTDKSSPMLFGSDPSDELPPEFARLIDTPYGRFGPFGATGPIGQLTIVPYSTIGIDVFNFPQGRVDNTFQLSDFVTWTGRRHTTKVGFDIRRSQLNSFADRNSRPMLLFGPGSVASGCLNNPLCPFATADGQLHGTDLAALGAPAAFLQTISTQPEADTTIGLRLTQYDFFAQSDLKVRPNLTLNLGLRYELQKVPREVNRRIEDSFGLTPDQFGHLSPSGSARNRAIISAGNAAFDQALASLNQYVGNREGIYGSDLNNLAPRIGLAWDPNGDGRMAVRAGFSLQFDANLGAFTSQSRNVFPRFVPLNLDLNFRAATGQLVNSPTFFSFTPTGEPLIRPGTLNTYNLGGDSFATGLGTLFVQAPPGPGASLSSNGLAFTLPVDDFKASYAQHFVFSVERQIRENLLVSLSYVGTRGFHLSRFTTPNAGLIATPVLLSSSLRPLLLLNLPPSVGGELGNRPTPGLGAFTLLDDSASSTYDSLQLSVEKRLSQGFQFRSSWTWAHAIDEVSDPFDGRGFSSLSQDIANHADERASANFDARHRLSGFVLWNLPGDRRVVRDWKLALVAEFQTGQPYTVNTSLDRNRDGNLTDRLDSTAGLTLSPSEQHSIRVGPGVSLLNLTAALGQNGRVGRNSFRAQGIGTIDVAMSRSFPVSETASIEFRVETFNLLNRTSFGIPVRTLESPGFGRSFDTQFDARSIRFALKFGF